VKFQNVIRKIVDKILQRNETRLLIVRIIIYVCDLDTSGLIGVSRRKYKETRVPVPRSRRTVVALCVSVGYVRKVLVMPTAGYSSHHARTQYCGADIALDSCRIQMITFSSQEYKKSIAFVLYQLHFGCFHTKIKQLLK